MITEAIARPIPTGEVSGSAPMIKARTDSTAT